MASQTGGTGKDGTGKDGANEQVRRESARRTRRSFLVGTVAAAAGYGAYRWIDRSAMVGRLEAPLRKVLQTNAAISRGVFDERGLAPEYPVGQAVELRFNGNYGLLAELAPESWRLQMIGVENANRFPQYVEDVTKWDYLYTEDAAKDAPAQDDSKGPVAARKAVAGKAGAQAPHVLSGQAPGGRRPKGQEEAGESDNSLNDATPGLLLTLADVQKLPHRELVTQFKCIEGWSEIVHWGGVRLADLMAAYPPAKKPDGTLPKFVYMETPDGDYYCGYDRSACLHPQSTLVTEMAGKPLSRWHGAPLRLHMPIKYGYKQIKRIGLIAYTDMKPDDYWTKLGYDWYAGL